MTCKVATGAFAALAVLAQTATADHPSVALSGGASGPITAYSAETMPVGAWAASLRLEYLDLDEIGDERLIALSEAHEHVHSVASVRAALLNVSYGLLEDLTVGLSVPYIERTDVRQGAHHHGATDTVQHLGDSSGLGNVRLYGVYRLQRSPGVQTSVLFGVDMPTGKDDAATRLGEEFHAHLQPGSGAWRPMLGLVQNRDLGQGVLYGGIAYTFAAEGTADTEFGEAIHYNLAYSLPMTGSGDHHHEHDGEVHEHHDAMVRWDLLFEINGEWRAKDEQGGVEDDHTGGNVVYFSPGIRATVGKHWSAGLSVGVPVFKDLNGVQSEPSLRVVGTIGTSF